MRPTRWRRSTYVAVGAAVLLVVVAVVAAAVLVSTRQTAQPPAVPAAPAPATAAPAVMPVPESADRPTPAGLAAVLAPVLADPDLGRFTGTHHRRDDRRRTVGQGPARADAARLDQQGADHRRGVAHAGPRSPADHDGCWPRRPGWWCSSAAVTRPCRPRRAGCRPGTTTPRASPTSPTRCAAAASPCARCRSTSAPTAGRRWPRAGIPSTSTAATSPRWKPVMLDGGRTQPVSVESRRSSTPALDAGRALAVALRVDPATVTVRSSAAVGQEIAAVQSPPLMQRLREMMNASDNVMAESTGREVAAAEGRPQSFDGAVGAVLERLAGRRRRHRRRAPARLERVVGRRPADGPDARRSGQRRRR